CPGAAFANFEMQVVLRTILRRFRLAPTGARRERWRSKGVAFGPANGGRVVVHRRPDGRQVSEKPGGQVGEASTLVRGSKTQN
ncbi:MAG: cytochrome family, partial [Gammaproteobacteria bacterium]|nr:cytochrome family [Gammaproteobacteria bacterium]